MIKIATLRASGLTDAKIVEILERHEAEKAAHTREQTRQRNIRWREAKKAKKINDHVTQNGVTPSAYPAGFEPDMDALMIADRMGLGQAQVALEIERFRDYQLARGKAFCDWQAAFRSWLNSPFFAKGRANGNGPKYLDAWDAAYAKLDAAIARERAGAGPTIGEAIPF